LQVVWEVVLEEGAQPAMAEEAGGCWWGSERKKEGGKEWKGEHRRGWVGVRAKSSKLHERAEEK